MSFHTEALPKWSLKKSENKDEKAIVLSATTQQVQSKETDH